MGKTYAGDNFAYARGFVQGVFDCAADRHRALDFAHAVNSFLNAEKQVNKDGEALIFASSSKLRLRIKPDGEMIFEEV